MPLAPPQRGFCFWRLPCVHTPGSWDDAAPHGLAQESKVLPCPGWLSIPICPPISSASCWQIASPRPVPPYWRVMELCAWLKGWKRCNACSGVRPIPVTDYHAARLHIRKIPGKGRPKSLLLCSVPQSSPATPTVPTARHQTPVLSVPCGSAFDLQPLARWRGGGWSPWRGEPGGAARRGVRGARGHGVRRSG